MKEIIYTILVIVGVMAMLVLVIGIVYPKLFQKTLYSKATREHIATYSIVTFLLCSAFAGIFEPAHIRQSHANKENQAGRIAQVEAQAPPISQETPPNYWHKVTGIVEGDIIKALVDGKEETIRINGIDTPNTSECYEAESKAKATEFLSGKWIQLEEYKAQGNRDKDARLLRYIWFDNGTDFGRRMIEEGYAYEFTDKVSHPKRLQYQETQNNAKAKQLGLWSPDACEQDPTPAEAAPQAPQSTAAAPGSAPSHTPISRPKPKSRPKPSPSPSPNPTPNPNPDPDPPPPPNEEPSIIKKSSDGVCHEPGTSGYDQITDYTSYATLQECLDSGGQASGG